MPSKVKIDSFASTVNEMLMEYAKVSTEDVKQAVKKTALSVKNDIKEHAPVDSGDYKRSWATKNTRETSHSLEVTVYSKDRYQLAHLLEKGHAKRGGGRTRALPHIAPAEAKGEKTLIEEMERSLSDG